MTTPETRCDVCGYVGGAVAPREWPEVVQAAYPVPLPGRLGCAGDRYAEDGPVACSDRELAALRALPLPDEDELATRRAERAHGS